MHGEYFTHLFYFRDWVREFQVLQEDLYSIRIYVASIHDRKPTYEDIEEINSKIRIVMGQDCRIAWDHVDAVPRTPQGKQLFTRSLVYEK